MGKWTGKRMKIDQVRKYRCIFDTHARRCSRSLISVIPRSAWSLSKYICFLSPVSTRSCRDWNAHLCSFCRTGSCLTTFSRKYAYICTYIHIGAPHVILKIYNVYPYTIFLEHGERLWCLALTSTSEHVGIFILQYLLYNGLVVILSEGTLTSRWYQDPLLILIITGLQQ